MAKAGKLLGGGFLVIIMGIYSAFFLPNIISNIQANSLNGELNTTIVNLIVLTTIGILVLIFSVLIVGENNV